MEEAKALARFSSMPGIVAVRDFFPENGTTYIVMEYIEGQTFKQYLRTTGGKLPAGQVFAMMQPVMRSLVAVHEAGLIHRDIGPDNIMVNNRQANNDRQADQNNTRVVTRSSRNVKITTHL